MDYTRLCSWLKDLVTASSIKIMLLTGMTTRLTVLACLEPI
nr:MAG TPA: hypothetical protein [Caudoviricetes sp.]